MAVPTTGGASLGGFTCPRCGRSDGEARFYGPCEACRSELRARFAGDPTDPNGPTGPTGPTGRAAAGSDREAARVAYEPRSNVTPNFVATKD